MRLHTGTFEFDRAILVEAIKASFAARVTDIDVAPLALSDDFFDAAKMTEDRSWWSSHR